MADSDSKRHRLAGRAVPVVGDDIDTDRIIPARFLKCVTFAGLGEHAFQDVRFGPDGSRQDHPFNDQRFAGASVLVVNKNFGCGSSREHAPQALIRAGIRVLVGESFAEIFAGNCTVLGVPAVHADEELVRRLQALIETAPETMVQIDLERLQLTAGELSGEITMRDSARQPLLSGTWDSTAQLLKNDAGITATAGRIPYLTGF